MTDTIHVHRADAPVPAVTIAIDLTQPTHGTHYVDEAQALFDGDAKKIADALGAALPGGTLNALLAELLTRQGCLLRVPMPKADAR